MSPARCPVGCGMEPAVVELLQWIGLTVVGSFAFILLLASLVTVQQQTVAIVERFVKFWRVATPGLNVKLPIVERVVGRPNLRVQLLDVAVETKTSDDVFVRVIVSVQFF